MNRRVVVTASDVLATSISGRGLRALGIAGALAREHHVTLLSAGNPGSLLPKGVELALTDQEKTTALAGAQVVVTGNELTPRQAVRFRGHLVVDLYDPRSFQLLAADLPTAAKVAPLRQELADQRRLWRQADVILCATTEQRDLYLGASLASRSLRELTSSHRLVWDHRVVVVPNGIDRDPPVPDEGLRARVGLAPDDVVLLWGGGVWDWMDLGLVLEALELARASEPHLRLLFLGVRREGRVSPLATRNTRLVDGLGRYGDAVVVNEAWIPPGERGAYLLASDAGTLAQRPGLETHFSFRTRLVDCLWAGRPVISTGGDPLTDLAARQGWGLLSPSGDVTALAANFVRFARDPALRRSSRKAADGARATWTWDALCQPLLEAIDSLPAGGQFRRTWRGVDALPSVALARLKIRR
jgi:glycosyltransferase involved in cell wall biosynthesis